jgi:hypothetical protein
VPTTPGRTGIAEAETRFVTGVQLRPYESRKAFTSSTEDSRSAGPQAIWLHQVPCEGLLSSSCPGENPRGSDLLVVDLDQSHKSHDERRRTLSAASSGASTSSAT